MPVRMLKNNEKFESVQRESEFSLKQVGHK